VTALGNLTRRVRNAGTEVATRGKPPIPLAPRHGITMPLGLGGPADDTEQLGLTSVNGTTFAVVDLLCRDVAGYTNSWHLYHADTTTSRGRVSQPDPSREVLNHAALDLWFQPNDWYDNNLFMWSTGQHVELTGKAFWVLTMTPYGPIDMWLVRPDRMTPVPDPNGFLLGWIYSGPTGEQIAIPAAEVVWIRQPNPMDPYDGLSPATPLQTDIESGRAISEWNHNFFTNSAEPGGVIQLPEGVSLSDEQFREQTSRWAEQHQGVSRAHRIAWLENGALWQSTGYSMADMQFVELRQDSRNAIYEGWGVGGGMLGVVEDVNRANMEGTEYNYTKRKIATRLSMYRGVLNGQFLAKYGPTGRGLVWDFDNPVPDDWQADAETMQAQSASVLNYVTAGYKPNGDGGVLQTVGVPEMEYVGPPQLPQFKPAQGAGGGAMNELATVLTAIGEKLTALEVRIDRHPHAIAPAPAIQVEAFRLPSLVRAAQESTQSAEQPDTDLDAHQAEWEAQLNALMIAWPALVAAQQADLVDQVRSAMASDDPAQQLGDINPDTAAAEAALLAAMTAIALTSGKHVVAEAAAAGVAIMAGQIPDARLEAIATAVVALLGTELAVSAARRATMWIGDAGKTAAEVAADVADYLANLSDAGARIQLGGALSGAQTQARIETYDHAATNQQRYAELRANEVLDTNTCGPCDEEDGTVFGSTADSATVVKARAAYPFGQFRDCEGRQRCRGTVTASWLPVVKGP
jgi:HK97 family phage portal protein